MKLRGVAALPIWRSRRRPREIVTGIVELVVAKALAIAFVSRACAVPGAMRRSCKKVVRVKSAMTAMGERILAERGHVRRLLGFLRFIVSHLKRSLLGGIVENQLNVALERRANQFNFYFYQVN